MSTFITVDDTNTTIQYFGKWSLWSTKGPLADGGFPFHDTAHNTTDDNSGFTLQFDGQAIEVFGVIPFAAANNTADAIFATYEIDSLPAQTIQSPILSNAAGDSFNFLLFNASSLPNQHHRFTAYTSPNSPAAPYVLDYIRITPFQPGTEMAGEGGTSRSHVGAIVGGVLGGVGGLLLLLVLGFLFVRMKRRKNRTSLASSDGLPFHRDETNDVLSEPEMRTAVSEEPISTVTPYFVVPIEAGSSGADRYRTQKSSSQGLRLNGPVETTSDLTPSEGGREPRQSMPPPAYGDP